MRSELEVELRGIDLRRGGRRILRRIGWRIRPGQRWVLVGKNGAGKTQLMKLLAGAVWPTPRAGGARIYRWRGERYDTPYGVIDEIAYLGPERQDRYERYDWNHTVAAVVGTGLHRSDIPLRSMTRAERVRARRLLERFGIGQLAQRPFLSLSFGERRLALLARALAAAPRLLLLDELLTGLDAAQQARVRSWLRRTARSRRPWVLSTHRSADVPDCATHALVLVRGAAVYAGPISRARLAQRLALRRRPRRRRHARTPRTPRVLAEFVKASVFVDDREVLRGLEWVLRGGECWVVHGANGAGKTTLLRTLHGDFGVAAGGDLRRDGIGPGVALELFKLRCGLVAPSLQSSYPRHAQVTEVVASGRYASIGLNEAMTAADAAAARRALRRFGVLGLAGRALAELSYGQVRRVLFARAWVNEPDLLLLDEPFAGLDAPTRSDLLARLDALVQAGSTVVIATHYREEWPALATMEIELRRGRALYVGPVRGRAARRSAT